MLVANNFHKGCHSSLGFALKVNFVVGSDAVWQWMRMLRENFTVFFNLLFLIAVLAFHCGSTLSIDSMGILF